MCFTLASGFMSFETQHQVEIQLIKYHMIAKDCFGFEIILVLVPPIQFIPFVTSTNQRSIKPIILLLEI